MRIRVFDGGKGDCLLLTSANDQHILVDGGHVPFIGFDHYSHAVADRLGELRDNGEELDLVCVSHIDQDHIGGVLRLLRDELAWRIHQHQKDQGLAPDEPDNARPPVIREIWHNAFHELISHNRRAIADAIAASQAARLALAPTGEVDADDEFIDGLATSMNEAARVSRLISDNQLGIPLNETFGKKLVMDRPDSKDMVRGDFTVSVLGPTKGQLIALRKEWNDWLRSVDGKRQIKRIREDAAEHEDALENADLAGFLANALGPAIGDRTTVTDENVASIIMLVEEGDQNILLTGDARDDHIHEALERSGKTDGGHIHLNVLKIQHHGSKNNFSEDFAKKVTADHYLFCGNGGHHNPHKDVVRRLLDSRLGPASKKSPNAQVDQPFKLWFSADHESENADPDHMRELEALVRDRAQASGGQMTFRFNRGRSFEFTP